MNQTGIEIFEQRKKIYHQHPLIQPQLEYIHLLTTTQPEIVRAIRQYTGDNVYQQLNTNIRRGVKIPADMAEINQNLITAFKAVPPLTEPLIVYRGKKSDRIRNTDNSYVSTSLFYKPALAFTDSGCCILQITVSPGSKILPIQEISTVPKEQEVLLDKNGSFILTGTELKSNMKVLYVTYIPSTIQTTDNIDELKDPGKLDQSQLQESVITYFTGLGKSLTTFDDTIQTLMKTEQFNLTEDSIIAIKLRLGILDQSCIRSNNTLSCKGNMKLKTFPEDIAIIKLNKVKTSKSLPPFPTHLESLNIIGSFLTKTFDIASLQKLTTFVYTQNTGLDDLPSLPPHLLDLRCKSSRLRSLPELPESLVNLDCDENNLYKLPLLPAKLTTLSCSNNRLTSLPELPKQLTSLICAHNNLLSLPKLPDSLTVFQCHGNPHIQVSSQVYNRWPKAFDSSVKPVYQ